MGEGCCLVIYGFGRQNGRVMDSGINEKLTALHEHLAATAKYPIETRTNRWLGEAAAVAEDLAEGEVDSAIIAERIDHVRRLLGEVESVADPDAAEHVMAADRLADEIATTIDQGIDDR